ncbi:MAG: ABC transporter substrate-binding protein [Deinococcus sp.]|nr:ABC transporter substrate-binding protein [Deinococcus sp.]
MKRLVWLVMLMAALGTLALAQEPVTLRFRVHSSGVQFTAWESLVAEFQASHPGITIALEQITFEELFQSIQIGAASGDVPDIVHVYSLWGVELFKSGILAAAPADLQEQLRGEFYPAVLDGAIVDGQILGVPTEAQNYLLIYNKDLFRAAGLDPDSPPRTWDQLVDMAVQLTKRDEAGNIVQYGYAFLQGWDSAVVHPWAALLFQLGGRLFNADFTESTFNGPAGVAALEAELELFQAGATDTNGSVFNFPNGTVAMMIMASWYENDLKAAFGDRFQDVVGVAPIPLLSDAAQPATISYTWFTGVAASSPHQAEAWEFIRFLADQGAAGGTRAGDWATGAVGALPGGPGDAAAYADRTADYFTAPFSAALAVTVPEPNIARAQEIKTVIWRAILSAWFGERTAQEALDFAAEQVNEILAEL